MFEVIYIMAWKYTVCDEGIPFRLFIKAKWNKYVSSTSGCFKVCVPRQNQDSCIPFQAELAITSACLQCTYGCTDDSQTRSDVRRRVFNLWFLSRFMDIYFWWTLKIMIPSESVSQSKSICVWEWEGYANCNNRVLKCFLKCLDWAMILVSHSLTHLQLLTLLMSRPN